jgi:hypothetical protein
VSAGMTPPSFGRWGGAPTKVLNSPSVWPFRHLRAQVRNRSCVIMGVRARGRADGNKTFSLRERDRFAGGYAKAGWFLPRGSEESLVLFVSNPRVLCLHHTYSVTRHRAGHFETRGRPQRAGMGAKNGPDLGFLSSMAWSGAGWAMIRVPAASGQGPNWSRPKIVKACEKNWRGPAFTDGAVLSNDLRSLKPVVDE